MFLTTKSPYSVYKLIVNGCKNNAEKRLSKKLKVEEIKYRAFPSLKFFLYFIYFIFSGTILSKKKRLYLSFLNVEIGRFIVATVFKDARSYSNKFFFYFNYIKNFYKAGIVLNSADYYLKNIKFDCIYIDHCGYLNGILYSFFVKKKLIYTNNYPKSIFLSHKNSFSTYENNLRIKKDIHPLNKLQINKSKNFLVKLINKPETIPWLAYAPFKKLNKIKEIDKYDYVIYTHSFTDGQLWLGNDGFENSYDWLDFTLKALDKRNKKAIVKCHPNYFNKVFGYTAEWDHRIFQEIYKKYKNNKNFYFIKDPVPNSQLMNKINKKCIAITHHGNVIFELAHKNFKIIASAAIFFSKDHKITNSWSDPDQYYMQLNKNYEDLQFADKKDLYNLVNNLFFNSKGFYGKNTVNFVTDRYLDKKAKKILMTRSRFNNDVYKRNLDKYIPLSTQKKICSVVGQNILS